VPNTTSQPCRSIHAAQARAQHPELAEGRLAAFGVDTSNAEVQLVDPDVTT
jgi:hypothetical protein